MRLIDADKFKEDLLKLWDYSSVDGITATTVLKQVISDLDNATTVEERPQGEWIFRKGVTCGGYYKCNKCGEVERAEKNYCPNCGALMKGGAE